jgi:CheY-like chemotaxis protein
LLALIPARINVERILIVKDDRIALRNVSQFLSGEGYQVERANNGDEALKLREKEKFDLVLSDVIMAGTDGHRFATTPIILMSGNLTFAPSAIFFQGANGYVLKPIDLGKLLEKIKDTFNR